MNTKEIVNAVIKDVKVEPHKRGCQISLTMDYGDSQQGCHIDASRLQELMEVLQVFSFDKIKGSPCRVVGSWTDIYYIKHFINKGEFKLHA